MLRITPDAYFVATQVHFFRITQLKLFHRDYPEAVNQHFHTKKSKDKYLITPLESLEKPLENIEIWEFSKTKKKKPTENKTRKNNLP